MVVLGGYHEHIGGCSAHKRDVMMNVGGYYDAYGRYHGYVGES